MDELLQKQLDLEELMVSRGKERYFKSIADGRAKGFGYREGLCDRYTKIHCCPMYIAQSSYNYRGEGTLRDAIESALKPGPGRNARGWSLLRSCELPSSDVAYIVLPILLFCAGEGRTRNMAVASIGGALEDEVNQREIRKQSKNNYHNLVRATRLSTARDKRYRSKKLAETNSYSWQEWTKEEAHGLGVALYTLATSTCADAITEVSANRRSSRKHRSDVALSFTGEFADKELEVLEELALCSPASGPLMIPAKEWDTPFNGGYYGALAGKTTAVHNSLPYYKTASARMWVSDSEHVQALNKQQKVAYRVNPKVWAVAKEISTWNTASDFDMHSGELMLRPREPKGIPKDTPPDERAQLWRDYMKKSYQYGGEGRKENSKKISHRRLLSVIGEYADMDKFYYAHFLDWRGRMYVVDNCGMSFQGGSLIRGLLEFGEGIELGERGLYWLKVHASNCWGYDKDSFDGRVEYIEGRIEELKGYAMEPLDNVGWRDADSPWEFLASCFDLLEASKYGVAHVSHTIVGQDGTCNGSQHMAAMVRCRETASKVNLVPTEVPNDLYGEVARATHPMIKADAKALGDAQEIYEELERYSTLLVSNTVMDPTKLDEIRAKRIGLVKQLAPILLAPHVEDYVDRKLLKPNVMTSTYNVSGYGMRQQLREIMFERVEDPKYSYINRFDVYGIAQYLHVVIERALGEVLVATVGVMGFLKDTVKVASDRDVALQWTTPTGHWVNHSYPEYDSHQIQYRYLNRRVRIRMNSTSVRQNSGQAVNGISANFTHSLDASHLAMTVLGCEFPMCTIHDSFGCHPSNVDGMRVVLAEKLRDLYKGNVLQDFRDDVVRQLGMQIGDKVEYAEAIAELPMVPEMGDLSDEDIVGAEYMFG